MCYSDVFTDILYCSNSFEPFIETDHCWEGCLNCYLPTHTWTSYVYPSLPPASTTWIIINIAYSRSADIFQTGLPIRHNLSVVWSVISIIILDQCQDEWKGTFVEERPFLAKSVTAQMYFELSCYDIHISGMKGPTVRVLVNSIFLCI